MYYPKKDFVSLMDVSAEEIHYILETAETMKNVLNQKNKKVPYLQGKSVILLFYAQNTRTKLSYELASQYLSANIVDISVSYNNLMTDSISQMGRIIDQMGGDYIISRHPMSGSAKFLAENVSASVINAGDGRNENPSQALLDFMTIKNAKGGFKGLKVAIIGDVINSRVTKSNIWGLLKLGAEVSVAGPPTMLPIGLEYFGVKVYYDVKQAVKDADVIMPIRLEPELNNGSKLSSIDEYNSFFKIDEEVLNCASKDVVVMHPGSSKTDVEVSSNILGLGNCIVDDQITNGVAVRMALLYLLSMRGGAR